MSRARKRLLKAQVKTGDQAGNFPVFTMTREQCEAERPRTKAERLRDPLSVERKYRAIGSADGQAVYDSRQLDLKRLNSSGRLKSYRERETKTYKRFGNK